MKNEFPHHTRPAQYEQGQTVMVDCGLYHGRRGEIVNIRWAGGDWEYQVEMSDGVMVWKYEDEIK